MLYENTTCPACDGEFVEGDDIVVCPVCGTPHHRSCWKTSGKCANEGRHEDGFVWTVPKAAAKASENVAKTESKDETAVICPSCGAGCPPDSLVCPDCGTSFGAVGRAFYGAGQDFNVDGSFFFNGVKADPDETIDGVKARDAAAYVQTRTVRYIPKFIAMSRKNQKLGWNWAAFFLSPLWFFYRKMYKAGVLFVSLTCIAMLFASIPLNRASSDFLKLMSNYVEITNTTTIDEFTAGYNEFLTNYGSLPESERAEIKRLYKEVVSCSALFAGSYFIANIFAALYGDYLYKSKMVREVASMRSFAKNDKTFLVLAMKRGGVSLISAAGCMLSLNLLFQLISGYIGTM